jgi:hypothetical protein
VSDLDQDVSYLRSCLKEALLDLSVRQNVNLRDVIHDSRIVETLLLLLDKLDEAEARIAVLEDQSVGSDERMKDPDYAEAYHAIQSRVTQRKKVGEGS